MTIAKLLIALTIFFAALSLFLLDPERREEILLLVGVHLNPRTVTGLSIIGMVFSVLAALKIVAGYYLSTSRTTDRT